MGPMGKLELRISQFTEYPWDQGEGRAGGRRSMAARSGGHGAVDF